MRDLIKRVLHVGVCVVSLASVANAGGTPLYDNLLATTASQDSVNSFGPLADSFSTGGYAGTIGDVQLNLTIGGPQNQVGVVTVELLNSNDTTNPPTPGTSVLATLGMVHDTDLSSTPGATNIVDLGPNSFALAANTRYWIELVDTTPPGAGPSSIFWNWSLDTSGPGVGSEFFNNANGSFPNNPDGPYQMLVAPQVIPEPSSAILLGVGLLGGVFAFGCSRKGRRAAA
jgi:hypothetical protein